MTDAKLAPKIQEWQIEHTNLYLGSGGTDGAHNEEDPAGLLGNGRLLVANPEVEVQVGTKKLKGKAS